MYNHWLKNPESVHPQWNQFFEREQNNIKAKKDQSQQSDQHLDVEKLNDEILRIYNLCYAFQSRGDEIADLDPLHLEEAALIQSGSKFAKKYVDELDYKFHGFSEQDLDRQFPIGSTNMLAFLQEKENWTLREVIKKLEQIYCGKVAYELRHLNNPIEKSWIRSKIENREYFSITDEQKKQTLKALMQTTALSDFLKQKFTTLKRFGIEGNDTLISGLMALVEKCGQLQIDNLVLGMPHRGRLNMLTNVFGKKYQEVFGEFQEIGAEEREGVWGNSGDVKYHLGTSSVKEFEGGHKLNLTMLPNPSHLETVNPVVYGNLRAIQDFMKVHSEHDKDRVKRQSIGVLIHGDAAFAGQGVVYESLQFQDLADYKTGGIIHIIVNNQIGFTTTPQDARTSLHCTGVAKSVSAPIIHVNGDDPDMVDAVMRLALDYRNKFKKDIVVDIIGYRRYGHNELDEPFFTQPLMYAQISKMTPVYEIYKQKLIDDKILDQKEIKQIEENFHNYLQEAFELTKKSKFQQNEWIARPWEEIKVPSHFGPPTSTGVPISLLKELGNKINTIPEFFNINSQIQRIYKQRIDAIENGSGLDFAMAEQLAFASLLHEGYGFRLSGQDVERGTFSHRHAVLNDQKTNEKYMPLRSLIEEKDYHKATIINSHLSEYGVLGYEFGYSLANPNYLVMWEAQFGDFSNGAQIIIDNMISSSESKWGVQCGLCIMLPHGMDGQGPEHSSGRMERYLQLVDDDQNVVNPEREEEVKQQSVNTNMQIVQCTTTSNFFHMLRRQMRRLYRKPLISFNSKRLLRYKHAQSDLKEFDQGTEFQKVIEEKFPDEISSPEQIKKVVLCSGQVYYDILERRRKDEEKNMAIIRIEQIAPFPYDYFKQAIQSYKNAEKIIWCQEEHMNYGPWFYVYPRINNIINELHQEKLLDKKLNVIYVGRRTSSSPAAGSGTIHSIELENLLNYLFIF